MLLRVSLEHPATASTLESCGLAITALAERGLLALVEPFMAASTDGDVRTDLDPDAVIRSVAIASGLGSTSAHTWLKLPVVEDMERVMAATTLPTLLLGGDPDEDPDVVYEAWGRALRLPGVRGLVVGRALLFPPDDDVAGAVDRAAALVRPTPSAVG
jgi:DhnA family fructose-bisphosphate aldolase class Ia